MLSMYGFKIIRMPFAQVGGQCLRYYTYFNATGVSTRVVKGDLREDPVNVLPESKYGGINTVTLLTGSTLIGQAGGRYVKAMLSGSKVPVEVQDIDPKEKEDYFNSVLRNRAAVHVDIVVDQEAKQKSLKICNDLDLYLFRARIQSYPGFNCRFPNVNIHVIAKNNMGIYSDLEYSPVKGVFEAISVGTERGNLKYLKAAFALAAKSNRKKVTVVHKAKEWPVSEGSMLEGACKIHKDYKDLLELEFMELEDCISHLVTNPQRFDCIFACDRYATFLATICSGVAGGATLGSAAEIGDHHAVFKPLQTKLSVTNYPLLSPYGIVNTIVDLFNHLGYLKCAEALTCEMKRTMDEGIKTKEFGGKDTGAFVICSIVNRLRCTKSPQTKT